MEEGRGGSQKIPRPESWHLDAPAPWGGMEHRDFTLDVLESAISGYNSRTLSDQTKERRRSAVLIPIYCSAQNSLVKYLFALQTYLLGYQIVF